MVLSEKWKQRFLDLAHQVASWSKDPSTQVGCVIVKGNTVKSLGYNGFPRGASDEEHLYQNRDLKYMRVQHAEANAVVNYKGDLTGCEAFVTHMPCCSCMGILINAGITKITTVKPEGGLNERFLESFRVSKNLAIECNIVLEIKDGS